MNRTRITDEMAAEIVDMYQKGVTTNDIATEMGVGIHTVWKVLRKADPERRVSTKQSLLDRFDVATLAAFMDDYYKKGLSLSDLVSKYDLSGHGSIYVILNASGNTPRQVTTEALVGRKLQIDHAVKLYEEGMKIWRIVEETGIDQPTLHHELHRRGVKMRKNTWA